MFAMPIAPPPKKNFDKNIKFSNLIGKNLNFKVQGQHEKRGNGKTVKLQQQKNRLKCLKIASFWLKNSYLVLIIVYGNSEHRKKIRYVTALDLIKCLKQIK